MYGVRGALSTWGVGFFLISDYVRAANGLAPVKLAVSYKVFIATWAAIFCGNKDSLTFEIHRVWWLSFGQEFMLWRGHRFGLLRVKGVTLLL